MDAVFDAIFSHFSNDAPLVAALPGGLWFLVAQQKSRTASQVFPYAVYFPVSVLESLTFTEEEERFIFQFSIFSKSYADLKIALTACRGSDEPDEGLDFARLSPSGYEPARLVRETTNFQHNSENGVWQATLIYRIELERLTSIRS